MTFSTNGWAGAIGVNDKIEITLPIGASFNTASITGCSENTFSVGIGSCTYATQKLTMVINSVTNTNTPVLIFSIPKFVNPSSALDQWPKTGGITIKALSPADAVEG